MATSLLLHTPGPPAQLRLSQSHGKEMYTMLQAPSLGGSLSFGLTRRGYGISKRKSVLLAFRAQGGRFSLLGTRKVKKEAASRDNEPEVPTGTRKLRKLPGTLKLDKGKKDNNLVFVAGANGKVGSRVVRELVKLGFQVRAGVRDVAKGQTLLEMANEIETPAEEPQSWTAKLFRFRAPRQQDRVELVEIDLEKEDQIEEALGDAGVVVCTIGASEKEVLDVTGPYRIDFKASSNLIEAATNKNVDHFILVTSLGTTKFGWPASVLNLFWGVLVWKAKAEKALQSSGLSYTIVRPGGMEKPTDSYKETHNLVLAPKDSLSGGQVSSLQVAELIATCVSNLDLARNKVLEAVAETTAPLRPIADLLGEASSEYEEDRVKITQQSDEGRRPLQTNKASRQREEKQARKVEAEEKKKVELLAKKAEAEERKKKELLAKKAEAEEKKKKELLAKKAEAEEKKKRELQSRYERELLAAREKEEDAKKEAEEASIRQEELERRMAELQSQARAAVKAAKTAKALETAVTTAARQGRRLSDKEKAEVLDAVNAEFEAEERSKVEKVEEQEESKKKAAEIARSKAEKSLQLKQEKAAKVKEEEDKAANASAEKERLVKEQEEKRQEQEAQALKAKAEEELKAKEAKAVADKEEKNRIAKEEEAKLEETVKAKAIAEKAEKDRVAKEESQAKAAAEAAKKAEEENENKEVGSRNTVPSINSSPQAAAVREREALQKAKAANTFRWPWQRDVAVTEPEPVQPVAAESASPPSENPSVNGSLKANADSPPPPSSQPLSPYTRYPDLQPPSSPTPSPQQVAETKPQNVGIAEVSSAATEEAPKMIKDFTAGVAEKSIAAQEKAPKLIEEITNTAAEVAESTEEALRERARKAKEEAATRAALALEKARAATSFQWPWQKSTAAKEEDTPLPAIDNQEDAPLATTKVDLQSQVSKEATSVSRDSKTLPPPSRPLSTYTKYPGLKPPTSPTPSPPQAVKSAPNSVESPDIPSVIEKKVPEIVEEVASPIKEVVEGAEEELKETARKAKEEAATRAALALEKARGAKSTPFRWPWQGGEEKADAGAVEQPPLPSANVKSPMSTPPTSRDTSSLPRPSRPLSPYTRYPGLKPPASPTPSPPKVTQVKKDESTDGDGAQEQLVSAERELESASVGGFKWPWQS